jgi:ribosomal protein L37E
MVFCRHCGKEFQFDDMAYCPSCGKPQQQQQPQQPQHHQQNKGPKKQQPKRGHGWRKIIWGGIMIIISTLVYPYALQYQSIQTANEVYCSSYLGGIDQGIDSEFNARCNNHYTYFQISDIAEFGTFVFGIIGFVLVMLGVAKK